MIWYAVIEVDGMITLPKEVIQLLELQEGDQVIFQVIDGKLYIQKKTSNH